MVNYDRVLSYNSWGWTSLWANWLVDFLTGRPQVVRKSNPTSSTYTNSVHRCHPKGVYKSPSCTSYLHMSLNTSAMPIFNFADPWSHHKGFCDSISRDKSSLNATKMKEMTVDYNKVHTSIHSICSEELSLKESESSLVYAWPMTSSEEGFQSQSLYSLYKFGP